jgi:hypothetical protein
MTFAISAAWPLKSGDDIGGEQDRLRVFRRLIARPVRARRWSSRRAAREPTALAIALPADDAR